jgi:general secretion pathway protein D
MKAKLFVVLTLLLISASQLAPQQTQPQQPAPVVGNLFLQNASLREVIDQLARLLQINVMIDDRVQGSVTLNTYGPPANLDARDLLELILRINGAGMIQEGQIYRIVPINELVRQPIAREAEAGNIPEDERMMLNLVFLQYVTVDEVSKVLKEFTDERTIIRSYQPANLLFILDSRRNMRRLMEIIAMFDSDTFAGERIRIFEIRHTLPSELLKELENVLKSISLDNNTSTVRFLPVDRIGKLIAVAPNPGVFDRVAQWIETLDTPITETSGLIDTYVYRVNYGRADCLALALNQLYNPQLSMFGMGGFGGLGMTGAMYGAPGALGVNPMGGFVGAGGLGGVGGGFGGPVGTGSVYGNQNAFNSGFGGAGMCGPYMMGGLGAGLGGVMPAFGGYAAQYPITTSPGLMGAAAPAAATPAAAGAQPANPTATEGPKPPVIVPNPLDNSLLIQANQQQYQAILKLLRELDRPPRQILLEAKIYQVVMSGSFAAGVTARFQEKTGVERRMLGSLVGATTQLQAGLLVGQARELLAFLRLEENASNARIISEPSLIATDSIPAVINVGAQVPVLTGTISAIGSNNPVTQQGIGARNTGVTLQVNARVNPSGVVTLIINQEISRVAGQGSSSIPTPTFDQQVVQTQITLQDGDTIAIGGIISESNSEATQGFPGLHRIPYLGALFGGQTRSRARTELILFMTPHVIYDHNDLLEASAQLRDHMRKLKKYIVGVPITMPASTN